jgi:hypothetical protein
MEKAPDVNFIELSPLQPFGTNAVLAQMNQKNVVSALRRSEVNADATTALFRAALQDYVHDSHISRVASNCRVTRSQVFDSNSKFLPHFKVFGEVSVGSMSGSSKVAELQNLVDHLVTEVTILEALATLENTLPYELKIEVGNTLFISDLIAQKRISEQDVRAHTSVPNYDIFEASGLDLPTSVAFDNPNLSDDLRDLGFKRGLQVVENLQRTVQEKEPGLMKRLSLHLGRIAGHGYYKHACFKISATSGDGLTLPLADGGTTKWAAQALNNSKLFTVVSGIGTELFCQYFMAES